MISGVNYLLVGNSRLHWAENYQKKYRFFHTQKNTKIPQNINLKNIVWASVGNMPNWFLNPKNEIKTKDIKLKNLPDYFGVDRALGCLAALRLVGNPHKKDLLIADCGTILSITKLTANGTIIGGQLSPGFLTQLRSMEKYTKNLKVPKKYDIPFEDFLLQTEDSMLKGVQNSLISTIDLSFNPLKDILILCGGDSESVASGFKNKKIDILYKPNLVMEGMISHSE